MKKLLIVLMASWMLVGCNSATTDNNDVAVDLTKQDEGKITYSMDDFAFYSEPNESGSRDLMLWLGMQEEDMNFKDTEFMSYYAGFGDVDYYEREIVNLAELETMDELPVPRVRYLSYGGSSRSVSTVKGISTTGFNELEGKVNSNGEDVIKAYGLNPDTESIYTRKIDENKYTIVLYFKVRKDGTVERIISPVGTNIDSATDVGANCFIKFLVDADRVSNIQMYIDMDDVERAVD